MSTEKSATNTAPGEVKTSPKGGKPFLKWAGGKTQMLKQLRALAPSQYGAYHEPFLGGGAFFFDQNPPKAFISDLNEELILTYKQVRDNLEKVISTLRTFKNTEDFYYEIRKWDVNDHSDTIRAARTIFLNKTCYNGLYRVNREGKFNVPYGRRKTPFLNEEALQASSAILQGATITHSPYQDALARAKKGDFVFLDPPYQPVGKHADFKRYTANQFSEDDQIALRDAFEELVERGCYVLLTNSDAPFILDLYKKFEIKIFETRRMISSDPKTRKGKDIVVIGNGQK